MMRDREGFHTLAIGVRDRFGDFGLVCVAILRRAPEALEIDTFLMSCRVLQRGVEQLAMNKIFELAVRGGHPRVVGRYLPTAKNAMVKGFYEQFGFRRSGGPEPEGSLFALDTREYVFREVHIREAVAPEASAAEVHP